MQYTEEQKTIVRERYTSTSGRSERVRLAQEVFPNIDAIIYRADGQLQIPGIEDCVTGRNLENMQLAALYNLANRLGVTRRPQPSQGPF